jgi:hypothetical protein
MLALACASASTARAVVVSASNSAATRIAPADNPGWDNVVRISSASGVYLGDGWVLTANHVGTGPARFSDGRSIDVLSGTNVQLSNPTLPGKPDLRMFRLVEDAGLPTLDIETSRPPAGSTVMMIGAGLERAPGLAGWTVFGSSSGLVWNEASLVQANTFGFALLETSAMAWGTNLVQTGAIAINGSTAGFGMSFDRPGLAWEAQAVTGDSGGGVFYPVDGQWRLAGIMDTQTTSNNQPVGTAIFGNSTQAADLSVYRTQILDIMNSADTAWQNQANRFDVNKLDGVTPLDALLVINELKRNGAHGFIGKPSLVGGRYYDVSGDGRIDNLDALQLINHMLGPAVDPLLEPAVLVEGTPVPEPSSVMLAVVALALLVVARMFAGPCHHA